MTSTYSAIIQSPSQCVPVVYRQYTGLSFLHIYSFSTTAYYNTEKLWIRAYTSQVGIKLIFSQSECQRTMSSIMVSDYILNTISLSLDKCVV